jgi:O-antigen/teichoic acid export membrane protein
MQRRGLELRQLVHAAFAVGAVLGVGGIALIVGWGALTPGVGTKVAAIAACALVPTVLWQSISGVLLGVGRVRLWNVIQTLPPVGTLIGMLVLVVGLHGGVRGAVLAWTLAHVLTALFSLTATRGIWMPLPLSRLLDLFNVELARLALTMGAVQVVNLISYRIELFVLDRYRGIGRVGVYSIAVQTGEMLWLVAGAIAAAVTAPALEENEQQAASLIARSALKSLAYTAAIAIVVGAAAPFLIPALLGHSFSGAARLPAPRDRRLRARDGPRRLSLRAAGPTETQPRRIDRGNARHPCSGASADSASRRQRGSHRELARVPRRGRPRVDIPRAARPHSYFRNGPMRGLV